MHFSEQQIWPGILDQRKKQVLREGFYVRFFPSINGQLSYLEYDFSSNADFKKFQNMFNSIKYHLDVFDQQLNEILTFRKDEYIVHQTLSPFDLKRIHIKGPCPNLQAGQLYIIAKNNSAIAIHTSLMLSQSNRESYDTKLQAFLRDPFCTAIQMEEELRIPFHYQSDLNTLQNQAIQKSLQNLIAFIRGPPGSGKTVTIARMVTMMAGKGKKVLIGSTSDVANFTLVNQIIKQLDKWNKQASKDPTKKKIRMIIHLSLQGLQKFDNKINRFLLNEQLCELIMQNKQYSEYNYRDIMQMIHKVQKIQIPNQYFLDVYKKSMKKLIEETTIALTTTNHSLNLKCFTNYQPQIGIVDEAALATLRNCYRFLSFGINRLICVGDQKQLAPFIFGNAIKNDILQTTMFKISLKNSNYLVQLRQQYRMHPEICQFTNLHVYEGVITNAKITHTQQQSGIKYFQQNPTSFIEHNFAEQFELAFQSSLTRSSNTGKFIGYGLDFDQQKFQYYNSMQGSLIMDFLIHVIPVQEWKNTTILCFYKKQMLEIQEGLKYFIESFGEKYQDYKLTVKTVDGYQGGQKDYIIVSTVRSNPFIRNGGFFSNLNRVNVALTRARKGLIVFGNSETLKNKKSKYEELNIWGKFFKFNHERKRVLDYWSLESIINKEIKEKGVKYAAHYLRMELVYILNNLKEFKSLSKSSKKQDWSLTDKNEQIVKKANKLLKSYRKIPINDMSRYQEIKIINDFLNEEGEKLTIHSYVSQEKLMRQIVSDFMMDHFTEEETFQAIKFTEMISDQINQVIFPKNQQELDKTVFGDNLTGIIRCEINTKMQQIKQRCHKKLSEVRQIDEYQYTNQNSILKSRTKDYLISMNVMFKFTKLFQQSVKPYFQMIRQQLNPQEAKQN